VKKSLLCLLMVHTVCVIGMEKQQKKEIVVDMKSRDAIPAVKVSAPIDIPKGKGKQDRNSAAMRQAMSPQDYYFWLCCNKNEQGETTVSLR